jgi:hypothetical protein
VDKEEMEKDAAVVDMNGLRTTIKNVAREAKRLAENAKTPATRSDAMLFRNGEDRGEVIANLMLAYRHLEDASMRLGKAIQARDGGVSVYDRATTVGA